MEEGNETEDYRKCRIRVKSLSDLMVTYLNIS